MHPRREARSGDRGDHPTRPQHDRGEAGRADVWQYDGPCGDAESTTEITLVGEFDQRCLGPDDLAALIPVLQDAVELARSA
jgi:hypothetical protein